MADRVLGVVLDQIDVWWGWFQRRVDGLSDDEYFWEPAPGCWTVRRQADGRYSFDPWPLPYWPPPNPAPVTTIAWRLVHMTQDGRSRKYGFAPDGPSPSLAYEGWPDWGDLDPSDCPGSADAALAQLSARFEQWREAIATLDGKRVWEPLGDREGVDSMRLGANDPFINVVQHINRELIHHGAEVALLRDLYRSTMSS